VNKKENEMKTRLNTSLVAMVAAFVVLSLGAQLRAQDFGGQGYGPGPGTFVDENGDGLNDLAPDADGDGIPNGMDEDYVRPQDGSGYGPGDGTGAETMGGQHRHGRFGNGSDMKNSGPREGFGPGSQNCDGTNPMTAPRRSNPNS
jgi:hypothetical protein